MTFLFSDYSPALAKPVSPGPTRSAAISIRISAFSAPPSEDRSPKASTSSTSSPVYGSTPIPRMRPLYPRSSRGPELHCGSVRQSLLPDELRHQPRERASCFRAAVQTALRHEPARLRARSAAFGERSEQGNTFFVKFSYVIYPFPITSGGWCSVKCAV